MQSTSCKMPGWMTQAGIKIAGRNINNLRYADDITLMAESKEELKSLLMKVKEESEKVGLNLAETPIFWPSDTKSWLIGRDLDAGTDWEQEEKGMTEDEMAGWHHRLDGHAFEWTPGVGDGQEGLVCCDSWGRKSRTWLSNWTELNVPTIPCYHHTDAAYDCSMYYQLSNLFCLCSGQQATTRSASSTRICKTTPDHGKYHSPLDGHCCKDSEAWD